MLVYRNFRQKQYMHRWVLQWQKKNLKAFYDFPNSFCFVAFFPSKGSYTSQVKFKLQKKTKTVRRGEFILYVS